VASRGFLQAEYPRHKSLEKYQHFSFFLLVCEYIAEVPALATAWSEGGVLLQGGVKS
jgi:hypothetical protein